MNEIFIRRSVRSFLDQDVEVEKIDKLIRAGMQAPSSRNQRGWKFVVITNRDTLYKLSRFKPYAAPIVQAPLGILVCADIENMEAPDYWQQDSSAATQNIMLEAVTQGLGTLWIGVAPNENWMNSVNEICGISKSLAPVALIAVGYPGRQDLIKFVDRYEEDKIIWIK